MDRRWLKRGVRGALGGAVLLAVAVGGWFLLRPPSVQVAEVSVRDVAPAVQGVGTVEAKVVVQVGAKITGRLVTVLVDQGHAVEPGQILARLDDAEIRAEVRRRDAALRAAEAQLRDLLAGARSEEVAEARANVAHAQAQLDDLRAGSRPPEIEELQERLKSATATRILAERDLQRMQGLWARELIAAQDLDRARQAYEVAAAQERGARQTLRLALDGARTDQITAARHQLTAFQQRLDLVLAGPRPEQVAAARAQVREAQAAVAVAQAQVADTAVVSPFTGYVVSRELEPGSTVNPGTPIFKIADPETAWVTVYVDERDTGGLAVGDPAEITLRSQPGRRVPGRVARIQRESDRVTEQLAVDIALETRPLRLTLGEQAEADIRPPAQRGAVALPLAAVVRRPDGPGALVVTDGRLHFQAARLGAADPAGWVQVLEGLRPGTLVVLTPGRLADAANDGRRVRVVRADMATDAARTPR